jgi:hypothetical protein
MYEYFFTKREAYRHTMCDDGMTLCYREPYIGESVWYSKKVDIPNYTMYRCANCEFMVGLPSQR